MVQFFSILAVQFLALFLLIQPLSAQVKIQHIDDFDMLNTYCKRGVITVFNWEFDSAKYYYQKVEALVPNHPVTPFFKAQIIFWEHSQIDYSSDIFKQHYDALEDCIEKAEAYLKVDPNNQEALFFKMSSHALLMTYHDDMEESLKAIGQARAVYTLIQKTKPMTSEYVDYNFTTGLYNYFRVVFPDKFPIYRPVLWFFDEGDKKLGLQQIRYAIDHGTFTVGMALSYLRWIYLKYEYNYAAAQQVGREMVDTFPGNWFFLSDEVELLLQVKNNIEAKNRIDFLRPKPKTFYYQWAMEVLEGMYYDFAVHDEEKAYQFYKNAENKIEKIGLRGKKYKAFIYSGLSRLETDSDLKESYQDLAEDHKVWFYMKNFAD